MKEREAIPSKLKRQLLSEHQMCELCGEKRGLEVHHKIPCVCGGSNDAENLIVLCEQCHAKLTPKKELTKLGILKTRIKNFPIKFYMHLEGSIDSGLSAVDVMDIFDEQYSLYFGLNESTVGRNA